MASDRSAVPKQQQDQELHAAHADDGLRCLQKYLDELLAVCQLQKSRLEFECDELAQILHKPWPRLPRERQLAATAIAKGVMSAPALSKQPSHRSVDSAHGINKPDQFPAQVQTQRPSEPHTDATAPVSVSATPAADSAASSADEALLAEVLAKARRVWKQPPSQSSHSTTSTSTTSTSSSTSTAARPKQAAASKAGSGSSHSATFRRPPVHPDTRKQREQPGQKPKPGAKERRRSYSPGVSRAHVPKDGPRAKKSDPVARRQSDSAGPDVGGPGSASVNTSPHSIAVGSASPAGPDQSHQVLPSKTLPSENVDDDDDCARSTHDSDDEKFLLHRDGASLKLPGRYSKLLEDHNTLLTQIHGAKQPAAASQARHKFLSRFTRDVDGASPSSVPPGEEAAETATAANPQDGMTATSSSQYHSDTEESSCNLTNSNSAPTPAAQYSLTDWWLPKQLAYPNRQHSSVEVDAVTRLRRNSVSYHSKDELINAISLEQDLQIAVLKERIEQECLAVLLPILQDSSTQNRISIPLLRTCSWFVDVDKGHPPTVLSLPGNSEASDSIAQ
eukprot:scpid63493/ scgid0245/ 